jgi:hypothetical protein
MSAVDAEQKMRESPIQRNLETKMQDKNDIPFVLPYRLSVPRRRKILAMYFGGFLGMIGFLAGLFLIYNHASDLLNLLILCAFYTFLFGTLFYYARRGYYSDKPALVLYEHGFLFEPVWGEPHFSPWSHIEKVEIEITEGADGIRLLYFKGRHVPGLTNRFWSSVAQRLRIDPASFLWQCLDRLCDIRAIKLVGFDIEAHTFVQVITKLRDASLEADKTHPDE